MIGMLIFTPLFIFLGTLYSLSIVPQNVWRREIFVIILTFVGTCVFIDLVFWVMWRGHNFLEWFLPITRVGTGNFIGYVEMIVISCISMELALRSSRVMKIQEKLSFSLRTTTISGVLLFLF